MSVKWRIQKLEAKIEEDQAIYAGLVEQMGNPHLMGITKVRTVKSATTLDLFGVPRSRQQQFSYNSKNQHMKREMEKMRKAIVSDMNTLRSMKIQLGKHGMIRIGNKILV